MEIRTAAAPQTTAQHGSAVEARPTLWSNDPLAGCLIRTTSGALSRPGASGPGIRGLGAYGRFSEDRSGKAGPDPRDSELRGIVRLRQTATLGFEPAP